MCAILLASSGASTSHAALPRLTPQSAQHYAAVLWWLQQQTPDGIETIPSSAALATALCERRDDPTRDVLRLVAILQSSHGEAATHVTRTPVQASQSITKAAFFDEAIGQISTPLALIFVAPRLDASRRLADHALAPHEALMRSGTSFCSFLE